MAAALRHASRRLGGCALQRLQSMYTASASTPAIVQVVAQRRLLQTVAKPPTRNITVLPGAKCAAEPSKEHLVRSHLAQIQTKKEELFGLISELDSNLPAHCTRVNRRRYRRMKRMNNYLFYGGLTYLSSMSVYYGFQVPSQ